MICNLDETDSNPAQAQHLTSARQLSGLRKEWNRFGTDLDLKYNVLTSFKLQDSETFHAWKDTLPFFRNIVAEGVQVGA